MRNYSWRFLDQCFSDGETLRAAIEHQAEGGPESGVYVHVDCLTSKVIRVGIATGAGGVAARWRTSHYRSYRYHVDMHLLPGTHSYPAFFYALAGRETRLYWTPVADRDQARAIERALILSLQPAWEQYRREFRGAGRPAREAVVARDWAALGDLDLGRERVADLIAQAGPWPI